MKAKVDKFRWIFYIANFVVFIINISDLDDVLTKSEEEWGPLFKSANFIYENFLTYLVSDFALGFSSCAMFVALLTSRIRQLFFDLFVPTRFSLAYKCDKLASELFELHTKIEGKMTISSFASSTSVLRDDYDWEKQQEAWSQARQEETKLAYQYLPSIRLRVATIVEKYQFLGFKYTSNKHPGKMVVDRWNLEHVGHVLLKFSEHLKTNNKNVVENIEND